MPLIGTFGAGSKGGYGRGVKKRVAFDYLIIASFVIKSQSQLKFGKLKILIGAR